MKFKSNIFFFVNTRKIGSHNRSFNFSTLRLAAFLLFLILAAQTSVSAATFTVNTLLDNETLGCAVGNCTLREAVNDANSSAGSDVINFQTGLTGTIVLTGGNLSVTSNITINGPGARVLSVSGNNASRVFVISGSGTTANIRGLTITGGNAQPILIGATLIGDGGGILNANGGTLNLTEVAVTGNSATSLGGGIATRAILLVTTTTNITRSLINNNTAVAGGGGISNVGTTLISSAATTVSNSTVTDNSATAEGGGISNTAGTMNLTNNTISNNQSTVAGGGIVNVAGVLVGTVNLRNTIIAQNGALVGTNLISSDGLGIFTSLGNNLIGNNLDITASFSASVVIGGVAQPNANADIVGTVGINRIVDPLLAPLANNGGATNTRALLAGSPAIDRGNNCVVTNTCAANPNGSNPPFALTTDQRGTGFPRSIDGDGDGTAVADIGAYEGQSVPTGTSLIVTNLNDTTPDGCTPADCTLREAVLGANANPGPDTINFVPGLNGTILLNPAFTQLEVTTDTYINGPGARVIAVDGQNNYRPFLVGGDGVTATIKGLTVQGGNAQTIGAITGDGGGILNIGTTLNLIEVAVINNTASEFGGGVATSVLSGGTSKTYITRSLIGGNQAAAGGGGIYNMTPADTILGATTIVTNSTVTNNSTAAQGGGVSNVGGTVNLINDTISHNTSALTGGGVVNAGSGSTAGVTNLRNSIVAFNNYTTTGGTLTTSDDVAGVFNTLGNNLIGSNTNAQASFPASPVSNGTFSLNPNNDFAGSAVTGVIDPRLGALQNNGGLTNTRAINVGSLALNTANPCVLLDLCVTDPAPDTLPEALTTDQRGTGYARSSNGSPDMGAYETQLGPSASDAFIEGMVRDAAGYPITRVTVVLTDMRGESRTVVTNQFGRYKFYGVMTGETYILSGVHKRYEFSPIVLNLTEDLSEQILTANPTADENVPGKDDKTSRKTVRSAKSPD